MKIILVNVPGVDRDPDGNSAYLQIEIDNCWIM